MVNASTVVIHLDRLFFFFGSSTGRDKNQFVLPLEYSRGFLNKSRTMLRWISIHRFRSLGSTPRILPFRYPPRFLRFVIDPRIRVTFVHVDDRVPCFRHWDLIDGVSSWTKNILYWNNGIFRTREKGKGHGDERRKISKSVTTPSPVSRFLKGCTGPSGCIRTFFHRETEYWIRGRDAKRRERVNGSFSVGAGSRAIG